MQTRVHTSCQRIFANRFYLTFLWKLFEWIQYNCERVCVFACVSICTHSQILHIIEYIYMLVAASAIAWHHQMPNDYYYDHVFILNHIIFYSCHNRWKCGEMKKKCSCILFTQMKFPCVATFVYQCVEHLRVSYSFPIMYLTFQTKAFNVAYRHHNHHHHWHTFWVFHPVQRQFACL